jgi:hypothetical protein
MLVELAGIVSVDEIECDSEAADVDWSDIVLVSVTVVSGALFEELAIEEGDRAEIRLEEIEAEKDEDRTKAESDVEVEAAETDMMLGSLVLEGVGVEDATEGICVVCTGITPGEISCGGPVSD